RVLERHFGRGVDLARLVDGFRPLKLGRRAVVELEGGMGIGKSALTQAFRRAFARSGRGWLNVASPPYGQDVPYTTLAGLLRGLLQRLERTHTLESILASSFDMGGLDVRLAVSVVRDLLAQSSPDVDQSTQALPAQLRKGLLARSTKALLRAA